MTDNELIAEWYGGFWKGCPIVVEPGGHVFIKTEQVGIFDPWMPDIDIILWHGDGGLLAKLIRDGKHHRFMQILEINTPVKQRPIGVHGGMWFGLIATPAQLTPALVAMIKEAT